MQWFILVALGTIWGASYLFIKVGGAEIPPITFVAGRTLLASLALGVVLLARRERILSSRLWIPLVGLGIFNGLIPYTLITWGEREISSGLAGILTATMPIFTVIIAHLFTHDERLNTNKIAGILIGFFGVVILFLPNLQNGLRLSIVGEFAVVVAAFSYAIAVVIAHKYLQGVSHIAASFGQLATGAVLLLPISLLLDHPLELRPSVPALAAWLTLTLLGTAFAYLLYYWLIEHTGATATSLVTYISPLSAIILGAVVLHESLDWTSIVGLLAISAGVGLVSRKSSERLAIPAGVEAE